MCNVNWVFSRGAVWHATSSLKHVLEVHILILKVIGFMAIILSKVLLSYLACLFNQQETLKFIKVSVTFITELSCGLIMVY